MKGKEIVKGGADAANGEGKESLSFQPVLFLIYWIWINYFQRLCKNSMANKSMHCETWTLEISSVISTKNKLGTNHFTINVSVVYATFKDRNFLEWEAWQSFSDPSKKSPAIKLKSMADPGNCVRFKRLYCKWLERTPQRTLPVEVLRCCHPKKLKCSGGAFDWYCLRFTSYCHCFSGWVNNV